MIPWIINSRSAELETLAAVYRDLAARGSLRIVDWATGDGPATFGFQSWVTGLLNEVRSDLGAVRVGVGFFCFPGRDLGDILVVHRHHAPQIVRTPQGCTPPGPEAKPTDLLVRSCLSQGSKPGTVEWAVSAGEPPTHQNVALFIEVPRGDEKRQIVIIEAIAIAVWAIMRDVFSEFFSDELWEHRGVDPFTLFEVGYKRAAYLFADIRGFTATSEFLTRESPTPSHIRQFSTIADLINEYASEMEKAISCYGRIDKFMGDGIMAVFGDSRPVGTPKNACRAAVSAAIEMLEAFTALETKWQKAWIQPFLSKRDEVFDLSIGIGIAYGRASFGFVTAGGTRHYSAIGSCVNLAQRLEAAAGEPIEGSGLKGSILATHTVRRHTGKRVMSGRPISWGEYGSVRPKGIPFSVGAHYVFPRQ